MVIPRSDQETLMHYWGGGNLAKSDSAIQPFRTSSAEAHMKAETYVYTRMFSAVMLTAKKLETAQMLATKYG